MTCFVMPTKTYHGISILILTLTHTLASCTSDVNLLILLQNKSSAVKGEYDNITKLVNGPLTFLLCLH